MKMRMKTTMRRRRRTRTAMRTLNRRAARLPS
jgi:hypothetical protein